MIINIDNKAVVWLLKKRSRIIITGVISVIIPLIGLSTYIYAIITTEFRNIVLAENDTLLKLTATHLEKKINTDIATAKSFADRPLLKLAIKNNDSHAMVMHLKSFIQNSISIEKVLLTSPSAEGLSTYPVDQPITGTNFSDKDWYRGVSARWEPYVSDFFLRAAEPKRFLFSISLPVRDETGTVIGIMVLHPKTDYFMDELRDMSIGKSFIYVVDKKGNLVYHPDYSMDRIIDFSGHDPVRMATKGMSGHDEGYDPTRREEVISAFTPMKWGWGVIMQRPKTEALQPVGNILTGLVIFTVIFLALGVFFSYNGMEILYTIKNLSLELQEQKELEKDINIRLQSELAERKSAELKLKHTLIDLGRSNKELEQFAYVASHDLQEPLRKVASFTELLERRHRGNLGPDADRYIAYIVDGAKRMGQLINDLLSLSRIGTGPLRPVAIDLNELVKRTLENLQFKIRDSGASVTFDPLPEITADESQMGMVFQNLIANAIKFHGLEKPLIKIVAQRTEEGWIFSVRDNGIGIEEEFFDRIFVMFQRLHTKSEYPGTGIGLAICKKVIERHGGSIRVESRVGKGSTFYFSIPVINGPDKSGQEAGEPALQKNSHEDIN